MKNLYSTYKDFKRLSNKEKYVIYCGLNNPTISDIERMNKQSDLSQYDLKRLKIISKLN